MFSPILLSLKVLLWRVLDFVKRIFSVYQDDQVFKSIDLFSYIYQFAYVEQSLHLWDKDNLVMVNDIFMWVCTVCCGISISFLILISLDLLFLLGNLAKVCQSCLAFQRTNSSCNWLSALA